MKKISVSQTTSFGYLDSGTPGETVTFLHGFPQFSHQWVKQFNFFKTQYHVICPDLKGYGTSSKSSEIKDFKLSNLVNELGTFIKKLTDKKVSLVAHDWGGLLAWCLAAEFPQLIKKLVIINAPHPCVFKKELECNPQQQTASSYIKLLLAPDSHIKVSENDFQIMRELFLKRNLLKGFITSEDADQYIAVWNNQEALISMMNYYKASFSEKEGNLYFTPDIDFSKFERIKVPTLIIWGLKDIAFTKQNYLELPQYVENLELQEIPDATHWVVNEKPELVNQMIDGFLKRQPEVKNDTRTVTTIRSKL